MEAEVDFLDKVVTKITSLLEAAGCGIDYSERIGALHLIRTDVDKSLQLHQEELFGGKCIILVTNKFNNDFEKMGIWEDKFDSYDFSWLINELC